MMFRIRARKFALLLVAVLANLAFSAATLAQLTLDEQIKIVGGFTPSGNLSADARTILNNSSWQQAANNPAVSPAIKINGSDSLFSREARQKMRDFFGRNLAEAQAETRGLLYFFGGPDSLYPFEIFPELERLVLVGLENPGNLPDTLTLFRHNALAGKMQQIAAAFHTITRNSYYITNRMPAELAEFGTSTMIAVGLASHGYLITNYGVVSLDNSGNLLEDSRGATPGIRFQFVKTNGQRGEVLYFRTDLSNGGMQTKPQFQNFIQNNNFQSAYYKAAMYAPHNAGFSFLNDLVLRKVNHVVQNDDGIPFQQMRQFGNQFTVRFFGLYTAPAGLFGVSPQQDLVNAYASGLCSGNPDNRDRELWTALWGAPCNRGNSNFGFLSLSWEGTMGFRYGYAGVSGPNNVSYAEKIRYSNLIVLDRR